MNFDELYAIETKGYRLSFYDWIKTNNGQSVKEASVFGGNGFITGMGLRQDLKKGYEKYLKDFPQIEKILTEDITQFYPSEIRGRRAYKQKITEEYCIK